MTTPNDDALGLVKALGFVAWSDERLAPEEKAMLCTVFEALQIPDAKRSELCSLVQAGKPKLDDIAQHFSDETERRFAMAQAVMMAQADGELEPSERHDLEALARALEIADDELQMIFAAVQLTMDLVPAGPATEADEPS